MIGCGAVCCAEGQGDQEEESCVLRSKFSTLEHMGVETLSAEAVDLQNAADILPEEMFLI